METRASRRSPAMKGTLAVTGNPDADKLLNTDPLRCFWACFLTSTCRDEEVPGSA